MKIIKAYTSYNDYKHVHYFRRFEIIDKLPELNAMEFGGYSKRDYDDFKILEINPVELDSEQSNDDVYNYDYYEIIIQYTNDDNDLEKVYFDVAIEKTFVHKKYKCKFCEENFTCIEGEEDTIEDLLREHIQMEHEDIFEKIQNFNTQEMIEKCFEIE